MSELNEMRERINKALKGCSVREVYERYLPAVNIALVEGKIEVVQTLLSQFNIHQVDLNNQNHVAIFYLASMSGTLGLLIQLTRSGFPVDSPLKTTPAVLSALQRYSGYTGLHFALKHHRSYAVQFLLNRGANLFIPNDQGITPLHVLFETKRQKLQEKHSLESYNQIVNMILQTNEQRNNNEVSHFHIACTKDEPEAVRNFLLNGACVSQTVGAFSGHEGFSPLHFAAKYKCHKVVVFLLKCGANVNQMDHNNMTALHLIDSPALAQLFLQYGADWTLPDSSGNTPLHRAFEKRNFKIVDLLLAAHMNNNTNFTNAIGISHFHIACTRNNVDIVKHFLENDVSVHSCVPIDPQIEYTFYWDDIDWRGCSPLHFAVAFNMSKIVELLLSENASVETQDARGFTPLHIACRSMHEKIEELMMKRLQNWRNRNNNRIDWTSNRKDHLEIIEMLLKYKSDVNCHDNFGNTPLFCAYVYYALDDSIFRKKYRLPAKNDYLLEMLERRRLILGMLLQHPVNLDTCRYNGSILHHMIKEAQVSDTYSGRDELQILETFLRKGVTVDPINEKMLTPLYVAVQKTDRMDFIQLLIEYGAGLNFHEPEKHSTFLHLTLASSYTMGHISEIFNAALSRGADPNARQLDGSTVLHNLASYLHFPQLPQIFRSLVRAGANVNALDAKGRTPLFRACVSWNQALTKLLLHQGADVSIEDYEGKTVLCVMYDEKLIKENLNNKSKRLDKGVAVSLFTVLLNHVTKKRTTVSDKVLLARGKIMNHLQSEHILDDNSE